MGTLGKNICVIIHVNIGILFSFTLCILCAVLVLVIFNWISLHVELGVDHVREVESHSAQKSENSYFDRVVITGSNLTTELTVKKLHKTRTIRFDESNIEEEVLTML